MFSVILNTEANCRWKTTFARLFQIREGKVAHLLVRIAMSMETTNGGRSLKLLWCDARYLKVRRGRHALALIGKGMTLVV